MLLACFAVYCLVAVVGITAGLVHLTLRGSAEPEVATVPLELKGFTTVRPADWTVQAPNDSLTFDGLASLASPDGTGTIEIAADTLGLEPASLCDVMMETAVEQGIASGSAKAMDPVTIDGRTAEHRRWSSEAGGESYMADAYCVEHGDGSLYILGEVTVPEGAESLPEVSLMIEQWAWSS